MSTILFTGFPGFLGSELLPRLLRRKPHDVALCLVQAKFATLARQRAQQIAAFDRSLVGRIEIVEGDITAGGLGIDGSAANRITEIFHLAAVYDLSVARELGMRINVDGTRNMLEFAAKCPDLRRFHYISTCYVSGHYRGLFTEADLAKGQQFNNFYEETKYLAEVEIQDAMRRGMPITIYRPSVVVGDSRTGATQKFDGPYFVVQWLLRQPRIAMLPVVGRPRNYRFNMVPRDFVIDAIDHLSSLEESRGKVYQLADPSPLTVHETIEVIARACHRRVIRIPTTKAMAKTAIERLPGVYRLMRIPAPAVDYFVHPTSYDTTNASGDLAPAGISVPRLESYVGRLIDFMRAHPEIGSSAMV